MTQQATRADGAASEQNCSLWTGGGYVAEQESSWWNDSYWHGRDVPQRL